MGRMLDSLKRPAWPTTLAEKTAPALSSEPPTINGAADEEMPFIEVGGPGRTLEGSPSVLAIRPRSVAAPLPLPAQESAPIQLVEFPPLPVNLQSVPATPAMPSHQVASDLVAFHQPDHAVSKQYAALAGQLLADTPEEASRALLLTGLTPGAGATTTLLNLAISAIRRHGREVVVVDANLGRPSLARKLGLAVAPGLVEVLDGRAALEKALQGTALESLHVLTAGQEPAKAPSLPAGAMRWVMGWLRERFGVIFVDGPAWEETREQAGLLATADAVYLVLEQGAPQQGLVRQARRVIAQAGGSLGGLLVTRAE